MNATQGTKNLLKLKAHGINDHISVVKLDNSLMPFNSNVFSDGLTRDRRSGRDYFTSQTGGVYAIQQLQFADGTSIKVSQIGSTLFEFSASPITGNPIGLMGITYTF